MTPLRKKRYCVEDTKNCPQNQDRTLLESKKGDFTRESRWVLHWGEEDKHIKGTKVWPKKE